MKKIIKKTMMVAAALLCIASSGITLASCNKIDDMEGMNDARVYYSYRAFSDDYNYQDAAGPFDAAINVAVGLDPIMGGNDDKVAEACDACYEKLKPQLDGSGGKVRILKTRHPDGKQIMLKEYKF